MHQTIAARLRDLRNDVGETQAWIAERIGVCRATYGAYERGTILPPVDKLEALASFFCVSVDYITGQTDNRCPDDKNNAELARLVQDLIGKINRGAVAIEGKRLTPLAAEVFADGVRAAYITAQRVNGTEAKP